MLEPAYSSRKGRQRVSHSRLSAEAIAERQRRTQPGTRTRVGRRALAEE